MGLFDQFQAGPELVPDRREPFLGHFPRQAGINPLENDRQMFAICHRQGQDQQFLNSARLAGDTDILQLLRHFRRMHPASIPGKAFLPRGRPENRGRADRQDFFYLPGKLTAEEGKILTS